MDGNYTLFDGYRRVATGSPREIALILKRAGERGDPGRFTAYDNATGRSVDLDTRGSDVDVVARLAPAEEAGTIPRGRGRPKLGVVAREVTLLPRHWEWLNGQPGGASVALRKLVEHARRAGGDGDRRRRAQEAAYHFMSSLAGDFPGFEEAARALFANDEPRFSSLIASWPPDIRAHATALAFG